jgi:ADP-ribose pyrophosphatase YjhB (NUDIX family)
MELPNPPVTNADIVLYDFINDQSNYVKKAKPIIDHMSSIGLIESMIECIETRSFENISKKFTLEESEFNMYDIDLLTPSKDLLEKIQYSTIDVLPTLTVQEFTMLPAIIAKRYIFAKKTSNGTKVSCSITTIVGGQTYELIVNCYNCQNKNKKIFKPVKGNIEIDDLDMTVAMSREIKEETGLTVLPEVFKTCDIKHVHGKTLFQFKIFINSETLLCRAYNDTDLDLEITCIKLRKVKIEETPLQQAQEQLTKLRATLVEVNRGLVRVQKLLDESNK